MDFFSLSSPRPALDLHNPTRQRLVLLAEPYPEPCLLAMWVLKGNVLKKDKVLTLLFK